MGKNACVRKGSEPAGRKLMEAFGLRPQIVLTVPILVGTDGALRMSKSTGNSIGINEAPGVIFTKVLNLPDDAIRSYAELATRWEPEVIEGYFVEVNAGRLQMRDLKQLLAREIVSIFYDESIADQAADDARRMFEGDAPSDAPSVTLAGPQSVIDLLVNAGLVKSRGEARRLIEQGGVRLNGNPVETLDAVVDPALATEQVIQAGKRKFLRVLPE